MTHLLHFNSHRLEDRNCLVLHKNVQGYMAWLLTAIAQAYVLENSTATGPGIPLWSRPHFPWVPSGKLGLKGMHWSLASFSHPIVGVVASPGWAMGRTGERNICSNPK